MTDSGDTVFWTAFLLAVGLIGALIVNSFTK